MPDVLPSCFGDHGFRTSTSGIRSVQNMVTCLYQTKLADQYRLISITWCKSLLGIGLSVNVDHPSPLLTCNIDMKPWLFWKKQGSKSLDLGGRKVEVIWDLSAAKFGGGPEPQASFYLVVACEKEVLLLLGDMQREAVKRLQGNPMLCEAALLSRKEHMFGKQVYTTRAQFFENGQTHDIVIECHTGNEREPRLSVRVDKRLVVQVKRLMWKFRGNQTILIDGLPIEVFWDVHNWLFSSSDGHAVFMFQTCIANEKPWLQDVGIPSSTLVQDYGSHSFKHMVKGSLFADGTCASIKQWPSSSSFTGKEFCLGAVGFSLLLYAWRNA
ncbi:hypothetical protein L7F22_045921 [Adiantum nelumboides]|nr:hypothetical protein [Adiantum nelumboides]